MPLHVADAVNTKMTFLFSFWKRGWVFGGVGLNVAGCPCDSRIGPYSRVTPFMMQDLYIYIFIDKYCHNFLIKCYKIKRYAV